MISNGAQWADTQTFEQAHRWVQGEGSSLLQPFADLQDLLLQRPPNEVASLRKSATPPKAAPKWRADTWKPCKDHMQKKTGSAANEIHLLWGFGSNSAPPFGGAMPLLFDVWKNEEEPPAGAAAHCLSQGNTN